MMVKSRQVTARQAKQAHRTLAYFILIFLAVHFATHFTALAGVETHTQALGITRFAYQFPLVEGALVLALAAQILFGIKLLTMIRKRPRKDRWHWAQFVSACYLAYFIVQHTAAALATRLGYGLDTNFYWVMGTLTLDPIKFYFAIYYTLAVTAIVTHIVAALHFRGKRGWHAPALVIGPLVGIALVLGYGGYFAEVGLPQEYRDFYAMFPGVEG
ncbi:MAG: hypothetical protein AAF697_09515 [Pseudomonadota bacterium]